MQKNSFIFFLNCASTNCGNVVIANFVCTPKNLVWQARETFTGEFGRTPKINKNAGRDHWGPVFTVALGGGGIKV